MGNRPHPQANGVDLAKFAERAAFERLTAHYAERANVLRSLGLNADVVLLTARFEVLAGILAEILAEALAIDPETLMFNVERQAVERALDRFEVIEPELRAAHTQHKAEGL